MKRATENKLKFAPSELAEREVVICLDALENEADICSCWPAYTRRLMKRYGNPSEMTRNEAGQITSARWKVAIRCISFRSPRKTEQQEPEQVCPENCLSGAKIESLVGEEVVGVGTKGVH